MFKITSMATALVLLAGVPAVHAEVVQLQFSGVFTDATWPTPLPGAIAVGNTFTLLVSYDTNALLTTKVANPDNSGNRYRYANDSVSITLSAPNFGPFLLDNDVRASLPIIVRDNFGIQPADGAHPTQEGRKLNFTDVHAQQRGIHLDIGANITRHHVDDVTLVAPSFFRARAKAHQFIISKGKL